MHHQLLKDAFGTASRFFPFHAVKLSQIYFYNLFVTQEAGYNLLIPLRVRLF
jgi:hypothetical protein